MKYMGPVIHIIRLVIDLWIVAVAITTLLMNFFFKYKNMKLSVSAKKCK